MSQHDMNIANQGFPAFRADLNDALVALVSSNSGASAPATTFANMPWYDTTNNIFKIRNEDNDAWISVFTLDQTTDSITAIGSVTLADVVSLTGTQTLTNKTLTNPVINGFTGNTAVVNIGSGQLYKSVDGNIGVGTTSPAYKLDVNGIIYTNNNLGFGIASGNNYLYKPTATDTATGAMSIQAGAGSASFGGNIVLYSHSHPSYPGTVYLGKSSGATGPALIVGQGLGAGASTEYMRVGTNGDFYFNSGYGSSALAYGCRAWVNFNGTGTVAIRSSGNVSSITDNGTGDYTVNFTTAMPDANYSPVTGTRRNGVNGNFIMIDAVATTSVQIEIYDTSGAGRADNELIAVAIFR